MKFASVVKHRSIWPVAWMCNALDVSRSGSQALDFTPRTAARAGDRLAPVLTFSPDAERSAFACTASSIRSSDMRPWRCSEKQALPDPALRAPVVVIVDRRVASRKPRA